MYKLEEEEYYFLVEDTWLHEAYLDFYLSYKEELNYGY